MMGELARHLRMSGRVVIIAGANEARRSRRTILDELAGMCGSADAALGVLARAGLADAKLLARRACELSEGQRHRYAVARAMAEVEGAGRTRRCADGVTVLIDEFASTLDRVTARGLAATVRRWVRDQRGVRLVCATAHDDVMEWLGPALLVYQPAEGRVELHEGRSGEPQIDPDKPR